MRLTVQRTAQPADPRIPKASAGILLLHFQRDGLSAKSECAWEMAMGGASYVTGGWRTALRGKRLERMRKIGKWVRRGAGSCDLARGSGKRNQVARFTTSVQVQGIKEREPHRLVEWRRCGAVGLVAGGCVFFANRAAAARWS